MFIRHNAKLYFSCSRREVALAFLWRMHPFTSSSRPWCPLRISTPITPWEKEPPRSSAPTQNPTIQHLQTSLSFIAFLQRYITILNYEIFLQFFVSRCHKLPYASVVPAVLPSISTSSPLHLHSSSGNRPPKKSQSVEQGWEP